MNLTTEYIIVGVIVAVTLAWAVRALVRTVRKTGGCSSCATSGDCPVSKDPDLISDLLEVRNGPEGRNSTS